MASQNKTKEHPENPVLLLGTFVINIKTYII